MYIKLVDSVTTVQNRVNKELAGMFNDVLRKKKSFLESKFRMLASSWIMEQPEIESLVSGYLAGAFGLYAGTNDAIVNSISNAVGSSVFVNVNPIGAKFTDGGITINFQPSDFINLLSLPQGHVVYEGGDLHWLKWLIQLGDSMIVVDYSYFPKSGAGRSKRGSMKKFGTFRVPPEFSGTLEDNFITRALTSPERQRQINAILQGIF